MNLLTLLNIKYPIILSPMAGVTTPKLAAEVSNAGGLGSLGLANCTVEQCREQILATQALTDKPFQVNFFCHQVKEEDNQNNQQWINYLQEQFKRFDADAPEQLNRIYPSFLDHDEFLNVVLETGVKVVSFHLGLPHPHQLKALKEAGVVTMMTATNGMEAQLIEQAGIDVIIAQGIEAGGYRGVFHTERESALMTADLVQLLSLIVRVPIIAAGGIMTGHDIKNMMSLGASACQLGTAFIQCESSNASETYRQMLFSRPVTQLSSVISGRPARGIINTWHALDQVNRPEVAAYPYAYDLAQQLHEAASKQGESERYATFWAGTGVSKIRSLSVAELMQVLVEEMDFKS